MLAIEYPTLFHTPASMHALLSAGLSNPRKRCLNANSPLSCRMASRVAANVTEENDTYIVTIKSPGVKADELSIRFEHDDDMLSVVSSAYTAQGTVLLKRQAKLPNADAETATAKYEDGVLTIMFKKTPIPEATYIAVHDSYPSGTDEEGEEDESVSKSLMLTISAPGVKAADILIEASRSTLSIDGETNRGGVTHSIHRCYALPRNADLSAATARQVDGILSVTLPTNTPKATTIKITAPPEHEAAEQGNETMAEESNAAPANKPVDAAQSEPSTKVSEAVPEAREEAALEWSSEWDMLLNDLEEMGFNDRESNRAALAKHSGSIKSAIKDLVLAVSCHS